MMQDFQDRVAFVTGAASGIGLGICRAAVKAGMKVMMADIENERLEKAAKEFREAGADIDTVVCDVSEKASVDAAAEATLDRFGKVHLLCNNAGISVGGLIDKPNDGDWEWTVAVNLMGVVYGCQAFVPHIKRQAEGGHILNTASMAGVLGGMAGWSPYNSSKFAVVGLTEVLRAEGKEGGYSASVLCPGGVATNIMSADRNRPERFGRQLSTVAYQGEGPDVDASVQTGLNPDVVGELVLEGIKANRVYIFTDPTFEAALEYRHQKMISDIQWAARSTALTSVNAPGSVVD